MKSENRNIFVTNDYFKKFGISRQILEYKRRKDEIKSIGEFKGMKLYYIIDADYVVIEYWTRNFRKFYENYKKTIELKEKCQIKIDRLLKKQEKTELSEYEIEQIEILPQNKSVAVSTKEFYELKKLIGKYSLKEGDPKYLDRIYDKYEYEKRMRIHFMYDELLYRLLALIESKLSFDDYMKKERIVGRWRDSFMICEYFIKKNKKNTSVNHIYERAYELHNKIFVD